jgi:hypothetical protein
MGVDVYPARHDHHAFHVDGRCVRRKVGDDLPILDTDVPNHTVNPVGWVIHRSTSNAKL